MSSNSNLKPFNTWNKDELKETCRKAGKRSAEVRKAKAELIKQKAFEEAVKKKQHTIELEKLLIMTSELQQTYKKHQEDTRLLILAELGAKIWNSNGHYDRQYYNEAKIKMIEANLI